MYVQKEKPASEPIRQADEPIRQPGSPSNPATVWQCTHPFSPPATPARTLIRLGIGK
jgi:hypothetical protein